jgi:hypothetical protein
MTAGAGSCIKPPEHLVAPGRAVPRDQLGQPAGGRGSGRRRATRTCARPRCRCSSPDAGALVRVIAGEVAGHAGPGQTHTPMTMLHVTLVPGAALEPRGARTPTLAYVLAGRVRRTEGAAPDRQLAALGRESGSPGGPGVALPARVLVLGGRRSRSRWLGTALRDEHGDDSSGVRGLPGRQAGAIPARTHARPHRRVRPTSTGRRGPSRTLDCASRRRRYVRRPATAGG